MSFHLRYFWMCKKAPVPSDLMLLNVLENSAFSKPSTFNDMPLSIPERLDIFHFNLFEFTRNFKYFQVWYSWIYKQLFQPLSLGEWRISSHPCKFPRTYLLGREGARCFSLPYKYRYQLVEIAPCGYHCALNQGLVALGELCKGMATRVNYDKRDKKRARDKGCTQTLILCT
jgi:hypothetical protein